MEIDMDMDFSGYSTITNTIPSSDDDYGCNWNHWSPVVNWDAFTGAHDDFHHLIDSIMCDSAAAEEDNLSPDDHAASNSPSASVTEEEEDDADEETGPVDDSKGLRVVHLLMAAAEALTGAPKSRDLARVILVRLKELVSHAAPPHGSNMERLAAYFTDALQGLLEGASGGAHNNKRHHHYNIITSSCGPHHRDDHHNHQSNTLAAFQLLQDMSPYVKFGHFTANQAILESVAHERRVHIVDYDIMEGVQWASLMQALASNKTGPPGPHLRITALSRTGSGRRSIATVQETGRRLTAFAASLGQPFSFHHCRLDPDETFKPSSLKLVRGEALVFNCMLNLPHLSYRAPDSVASFLSGAKALKPRLVTLVEEEVGSSAGGFVGRFMESLHHYSAVFDSLEAGFPMQGRARALVERVFFGPRIVGSLGRLYRTGEEERGSWGEWLGAAGFRGVPMSFANHCQAKLLIGLFNDGYRVEELGTNKLVLDWKSRRLLSASLWTQINSF
ncbi:nodulation-signaling pathway 2 protein-like [Glycine soja]|uniref:Nodulation-signaling pathway 2 protein n=1 Tax=Glycine soja TaxID=3848 RepID=A0A445L5I2_GLYSO|nr:nodulation-signaling pathway 2 protein-like [Glycine soja]RZC18295.1 Nodulation-signaling pathway 2 protein [Glycine soja]